MEITETPGSEEKGTKKKKKKRKEKKKKKHKLKKNKKKKNKKKKKPHTHTKKKKKKKTTMDSSWKYDISISEGIFGQRQQQFGGHKPDE